MEIKFGTSGWRDIIGDNFTFDNVKLVTQAIADYINSEPTAEKSVIVGYDTRFLSEEFAKLSCSVLAANNIKSFYCNRATPTPVISFEIINRKLNGGINFTASHNPPEYNGIKFSPSWGGPALPEQTKRIESRIKELLINKEIKQITFEEGKKKKLIEEIDTEKKYLKHIKELVDLNVIKKSKLKIGVDLLYGTAKGYLDEILKDVGCKIFVLHDYRDVLFGGRRPEPDDEGLSELKKIIRKQKLDIGLSVDGDADRFGIVDRDGTFITPNQVIALLLYHLIHTRNWTGIVARSVMTTHFIDAIAKKNGIDVKETPVGFKFIGDIMVTHKNEFIIGGEESGGLSIRGHVPEKDGILACLLMAEMVAIEKKTIKEILNMLMKNVGKYITKRINIKSTSEIIETLKEKLKTNPPISIAGLKVNNIVTMDGYKFILEDNSWVGMRISGTEPVVRLYIETDRENKLESLINSSKQIIGIK